MFSRILVGAGLSLAMTMGASAADLPARVAEPAPVMAPAPAFTLSVTPYMWAAGFTGDVGRRNRTIAHLNYDFARVIDTMNFAAMGLIEARHGRFSLSSDLIYLRITDRRATERIGPAQINVGVGLWQWTPLAGYAVYQDGRSSLDIVGGVRLWSVKSHIHLDTVRFGARDAATSRTWADAVGGVRARIFFNDRIFFTGWALAGGGGSKYMWDVMAGLGYRFDERFSASLGYRAEHVRFEQSGFTFDTTVQGPIATLQISF